MSSQPTLRWFHRSTLALLGFALACSPSNTATNASGGASVGRGGAASGGGLGSGGRSGSGGSIAGDGGSARGSGGGGGANASGGTVAGTGGSGSPGGGVSGASGSGGNASGGNASGGRTGGGAGWDGAASGGATTGGSTGGAGGATTGGSTGSGGATASGGSTGSGGSASGGAGGATGGDPFALAWQDDFNSLDSSLWQLVSFTYDGNEATFTPNNASVANGKLTLALTKAPNGAAKPYLGVEMRSTKTITYGKVSASMRFASGSGVVSGLVLFYTPYPNCNWNEIDIEHLGKSATSSQLNCMIYTGNVVPACTTSVTPTQDPQVVGLGANAETAFHQYDIEWTPAGVKFYVDGKLLRTWTANIALLNQPLTVLLTIWASSAASWAGAIDASAIPTSAEVDWIKIYNWKG